MIEELKKKIKEIEKKLIEMDINMVNYEYYSKLIEIHADLWGIMYFKVNTEKDYLKKEEEVK